MKHPKILIRDPSHRASLSPAHHGRPCQRHELALSGRTNTRTNSTRDYRCALDLAKRSAVRPKDSDVLPLTAAAQQSMAMSTVGPRTSRPTPAPSMQYAWARSS